MSIPKNCFECKYRKIEQKYINGAWRTVKSMYIGIKGQALTVIECKLLGKRLAGNFKNGRPSSCPLKEQEDKKEFIGIDYEALLELYEKFKGISSNNYPSNCKNCGAPLISNQCEYCGTKY